MPSLQDRLTVAAISLNIAWGDVDENIFATAAAIEALPNIPDVIVLPETFSTGYIADNEHIERVAQDWHNSTTIRSMTEWARTYNAAICGTLLIKDGDQIFNRAVFVEPSGEITYYDKRHLFALSKEAKHISAGRRLPPVVRYRGWNIALAICYDIRFPAWCRNQGLRYDILLVPANWPQAREYAWQNLLKARAIENQSYVVGANRSGNDDFGSYDNQTFVFDSMGKPIDNESDNPTVVCATFSRETLQHLRRSFPVSLDADRFDIEL